MTKLIPAEKLEALQLYWPGNRGEMFPAMTKEGSRPRYVGAKDLRALIDAEPESVEPVAVIALRNAELANRVSVLEDLLSSAYAIANRNGSDTHWPRFASQLHINGISPITAKTFKVLHSDVDYSTAPPAGNLIAELVEALSALVDKELFCTDREIIGGIDVQDVLKARELLKRAKEATK